MKAFAPWSSLPEAALGDLALESGEAILDYRQSYVAQGELDAERRNAVLVCASLTGNHHRLDFLIGPGKALDPARWYVVATDPIGNGLSTSPSTSERQPRMRFPRFSIRDMVSAQHRLLVEHLGLRQVHAVAGASMGGMQALQWAVSHPDFMARIVAMTLSSGSCSEACTISLEMEPGATASRRQLNMCGGLPAERSCVLRMASSCTPSGSPSAGMNRRKLAPLRSCSSRSPPRDPRRTAGGESSTPRPPGTTCTDRR